MSSTGTMTSRSSSFLTPASTSSTGRNLHSPVARSRSRPARNRPTSASGRWVADKPTRCGAGRPAVRTRWSSRSSDRARWVPRLVAATACTSSTMTVSTCDEDRLGLAGEQQVQRFGRRDEDVGRRSTDLTPLLRGGVAGAAGHPDIWQRDAEPARLVGDTGKRSTEVALHVVGERLQRADIEDPAPRRVASTAAAVAEQAVECPEERGERLPGTRRGADQGVRCPRRSPPIPGPGRPWARRRHPRTTGGSVRRSG